MSANSDTTLRIGARLKHARKVKRLTLKALADAAGCSESLLSKIENEKITPSLQMLHRIVGELGITIGHLMESSAATPEVVTRKGQRPVLTLEGNRRGAGTRIEWLTPQSEMQLLQASIHIVVPGAGSKGQITHEGEEMGYVLEGTLTLTIGETTYDLSAGDSFFFRSHIPHGYVNNGDQVVRVVWATTPPTF